MNLYELRPPEWPVDPPLHDAPSGSIAQRRAVLAERLLIDLGEVTEIREAAAVVTQLITSIGGATWAQVVQHDTLHGHDGPGLVLATSGARPSTSTGTGDDDFEEGSVATLHDTTSGLSITIVEPDVPPIAIERALRALVTVIERIERQQQLLSDARTDPLTGLLNRRAFDQRLEAELARLRRGGGAVSVLLLDVDHFKRINDTLGHARGDAVLQSIAEAMRDGRVADDLGRIGGDEFAVLLPDTDEAGAVVAAERLCARIESVGIGITASIGVATARPGRAGTVADLLRWADDALYEAKRAGRGRVAVAREVDAAASA